jgi:hypothetical protein
MERITINQMIQDANEILEKMAINEILSNKQREDILFYLKAWLMFYLRNYKYLAFYVAKENFEKSVQYEKNEYFKEIYKIAKFLVEKLEEKYMSKIFEKFFDI